MWAVKFVMLNRGVFSMFSPISFASRAYFAGDSNPKPRQVEYERILSQAKKRENAETGDYTISRNAENGSIVVGRKDIAGFYGIVFKPDGSVIENRAPVHGGPKQVLAPGEFDFSKAEEALKRASETGA
jgi:hypothetical protein